jgi:SAM-dependent methyltransferase
MTLYAATIFLGAFLLFVLQPAIAKAILPWFGGTAAVWTTCLLFFQAGLLLGYLYAERSARLLSPRRQGALHALLLLASCVVLPVVLDPSWKPAGQDDPVWRILGLLAVTVGVPYLVLSATNPLLQAWYAGAHGGRLPWALYAVSNAGSLLGLLAYPLVAEPLLSLRGQLLFWSGGYAAFVLLCGVIAVRTGRSAAAAPSSPETEVAAPSPPADRVLWAALAACGTALLMAVTNHVTQNVVPFPFLWVLFLALYLLSFILCFSGAGGFYRRGVFLPLAAAGFVAMAWQLAQGMTSLLVLVPLYAAALFAACTALHGELYRLRPAPARLTGYYLLISAGGALGGLLVAVGGPLLLDRMADLHVAVALTAALLAAVLVRESRRPGRPALPARLLRWAPPAAAVALAGFLGWDLHDAGRDAIRLERNFYGALSVVERGAADPVFTRRTLGHGVIIHGIQFTNPRLRRVPTAAFGLESGIGLALRARDQRPLRVGVIGLGAGTLATYGLAGDLFRFYEINPQMEALAREEFTFLGESPAKVEVALGDGRLVLEREPPQGFDLLVLDAFSGDSIPAHLLTGEAFDLYRRHLAPGGVIAVNVSNWYLDLAPVAAAAAARIGRSSVVVRNAGSKEQGEFDSVWVLAAEDPKFFLRPPLAGRAVAVAAGSGSVMWTDQRSSLFDILRSRG